MSKKSASGRDISIVESIKLAEDYLSARGVPSARLSAELILSNILCCKRLDLYLRFDEKLSQDVLGRFREALKKRGERVPVQLITGETEFYSLPFKVSEGVFIPRPETELLVEWVEEIMGTKESVYFLEFGVGTGVISGTLAKRHEGWRGVAFDVSVEAVSCARTNMLSLRVADRVALAVSDGFTAIDCENERFDLVVSNPPYIPADEIDNLEPEVARYEVREALDGGADGFRFYPEICYSAFKLLKPGGVVVLEIGHGQMATVKDILKQAGFEEIEGREDYNGFERLVMGVK